MFVLTYQEDGRPARKLLTPGDIVIGRGLSCDVIINDTSVSRKHAQISVTAQGCTLTDLASRNGIRVNGALVSSVRVGEGDRILLGEVPMAVEISAADRLALTEDHALLEDKGTIFRAVVPSPGKGEADAGFDRSARLLAKIGESLVQNRPLAEVLDRVVQLAFDTCPAERAFLVLRNDATGELVPRVARRRSGEDIGAATLSRAVINRVITERIALLASDIETDAQMKESATLVAQQVRSFMCAPLWHAHDVIGILYVDASNKRQFTSTDLDLLAALSSLAAIAIEQARLASRLVEEERRREKLQRYHSPGVVSKILEAGSDVETSFLAQEREISVLFADIDGFTTLSEGMSPQDTARLLNRFFGRMADVVFDNEGTLDKFIGDALMAVYGAPIDQPDHATRAVRTAQLMQQAIAELNASPETLKPLMVRIGIHSGIAMAGDIGSVRRRDYTVLGDVVNTASRLESDVAQAGQVVISRATFDLLDQRANARSLGQIRLRGREQPIEAFEIDTTVALD